ncbi:hypothetical protein NB640_01380 [Oxalobacter vibrioformis]|uniref:Uncharacterized protein n=1 Tax=Oxalobacter vibrioformis TaxID=933080 RepID=A0A9E9LXY4_9BURK|nr:hypothetical protein [Oxalobacter vibrioformis]WAW10346.1 hypothetical protein NB640_01380 [Oxalobacter vibrioformis]
MADRTRAVRVSERTTRLVGQGGVPVVVFIEEGRKHANQNACQHGRVFCFIDNR